MIKKTTMLVALFALVLTLAMPMASAQVFRAGGYNNDYADGVARNSNASPDANASNINNYVNQDEQLNLEKGDGTVRVLRTDQKANVNDFVSFVVELENATPRELRRLARVITRKEGGDALSVYDKKGGRNYLHFTCPAFQVPYIQKVFDALDLEWASDTNDGSAALYYKAKHRDVKNILPIALLYASGETETYVDEDNNAAVWYDSPPCLNGAKAGFKLADIPESAMTLEVEMYEVEESDQLMLGPDFLAWKNGPGSNLFRFAFFNSDERFDNNLSINNWWRYTSYNFLATSAYVDFMRSKGKADQVSQALLTVRSGDRAILSNNQGLVGFSSGETTTNGTVDVDPFGAVDDNDALPTVNTDPGINAAHPRIQDLPEYHRALSYEEVDRTGVWMSLEPVVGLESAEMDVEILTSDAADYQYMYEGPEDARYPVGFEPEYEDPLKLNYFYSKVVVKDRVPFVLGGIKRNQKAETTIGIPFLVRIPVLGKYIFGHTTEATSKKEVVVFLTPYFEVFSMRDASAPKSVRVAQDLMADKAPVGVPSANLFFDQWLLD